MGRTVIYVAIFNLSSPVPSNSDLCSTSSSPPIPVGCGVLDRRCGANYRINLPAGCIEVTPRETAGAEKEKFPCHDADPPANRRGSFRLHAVPAILHSTCTRIGLAVPPAPEDGAGPNLGFDHSPREFYQDMAGLWHTKLRMRRKETLNNWLSE
jgi:hypothetical protein